jgi:hypothetical protein
MVEDLGISALVSVEGVVVVAPGAGVVGVAPGVVVGLEGSAGGGVVWVTPGFVSEGCVVCACAGAAISSASTEAVAKSVFMAEHLIVG